MIHFRPVMLLTISFVIMQMVSQRRFITSSSELNTSFLNPIERICFQICSMWFISGVYGGMERSCMFSGHFNAFDLCHAAPSQTSRMMSSGNRLESSAKNTFVHPVSQFGMVRKKLSLHSAVLLRQMHIGFPVYDDMARKAAAPGNTSNAWVC